MRAPPHLHQDVFSPATETLTDRQRRFVDNYMASGGRQTEAAIDAGYAKESAQTTASRMLRLPHVQKAIMRETLVRIGLQAVPALHTLERLRDSSRSDYVKLEAARDLLDRAGFRPPERVDHRLDASLTVELVLTPSATREGGSKPVLSDNCDPPDARKSRPELDFERGGGGTGLATPYSMGGDVAFPTEPGQGVADVAPDGVFFTEEDVFSTNGEDPS